MALDFQRTRDLLYNFNFGELFIDVLGWSQPSTKKAVPLEIEDKTYQYKRIAEASGVVVFEVTAEDGKIPETKQRSAIHKEITERIAENLLIFVDQERTRSLWYWVKREGTKRYFRDHLYVKGQPGDLFLGKLGSLVIDITELEEGEPSVVEIAQKLQSGFDVERVTKKFYKEFQEEHQVFLQFIRGIENEVDRRWYTSVILNRLMFVYFLQRKGFIDNGDLDYLQNKLKQSQQRGEDGFFREFLQTLFFEGFAKPEAERNPEVQALIGRVKYLNGGLFLKHRIEQDYPNIAIADAAFEQILGLFSRYSWNLDDTPGGKDDEINPDVLGYIFEKYINQKAFGAYYTRPEITEYLCDRTINKLILDRVNSTIDRQFEDINELLIKLDANLCDRLIHDILPNLSLLDPACGSGAFLVAAMKTLISVYTAVIGTIKLKGDRRLTKWLNEVEANHPSLSYFVKKRIITDNLYGVDIMEEATEIAKLRLFLALVSSAQEVEELEPLPNIDFKEMLFTQCNLGTLFGIANERFIFEGVDHRFKFCLLDFEKGGYTNSFNASFRIDPREAISSSQLESFLNDRDEQVEIPVSLIRTLSPDSLSVMEFKHPIEYSIAKKVVEQPRLNEKESTYQNIKFTRELAPSSKSNLFHTSFKEGLCPIIEGRMIHQFTHLFSENTRFWIKEEDARSIILKKILDKGQKLDYQTYRLAFRKVARSTDERTMIATIIPPYLCAENLQTVQMLDNQGKQVIKNTNILTLCAIWNSFVYDSLLRLKVSANINYFFVYSTQVSQIKTGTCYFNEIVERAAKLICTTPEFDDLAQEVGLGSHQNGITDETERAKLRAELDGMIAHLYGLTEDEFKHILSTFPIVPEETKQAALEAYKTFTPITGDPEIINLITQGESVQLEFKSSARWDMRENKQNKVMEDVILKTVAGFLNSYQGGTLLIGVDDDGNILGLNHDYKTIKKKNRDGYELFLTNDLLLKELGKDLAPYIHITFHEVEGKDVCRIILDPSPRPAYIKIKDAKSGQTKECLFIRTGNLTSQLDTPSAIHNYCKNRWS